MPHAADRIRNVALVGHRGSGKTSLHEALLFEAGAITRLGTVGDGTTVSDADEDEKARGMSISASLASFKWRDVKVNLIDTPGEPSFVADALGALRVCESAVFVVNGVMGVEVSTQRLWQRAAELGVARLVFVNMLDRERADFFRTLDSLKSAFGPHVVATEIPIGREHEIRGVIDLVDMKAYEYDGSEHGKEIPIPDDLADQAQEYREKLMDEVAENSDALMERYLEGEEISHDEIVNALEDGTDHGHIFPVCCGVATTRLGADRLLDTLHDPDAPDPQQLLDASELKDRLADAISALPEREKLVIALYYYENLTLREIGEVLGVTESRISQLHTKAVLRLKSRLQGDNLRD
jgi:elongation factor G